MNDDRMSIVNDLTNEIFGCLDKLDNLYETVKTFSIIFLLVTYFSILKVTKSSATQNTILKESIERTYSDLLKRINNN